MIHFVGLWKELNFTKSDIILKIIIKIGVILNIDIYCDESLHDLFTSKKSKDKYMFIGSLWIDREIRDEIKLVD